MTADEFRALLSNPQAYLFQMAKAILTGDMDTQVILFGQIEQGQQTRGVMVIALAEFAREVREHRGDDAVRWLDARMQIGLDDPGSA